MEPDKNDLYLCAKDLAEMFHVGDSAVNSWRQRGSGPPYKYLRGRCVYRVGDIRDWIAQFDTKRGRYLFEDVETWLAKREANLNTD